jgi:Protein of unknown function (DUF5663)
MMSPQIPDDVRKFLEDILDDANMQLDSQMREGMVEEVYYQFDNYLTSVIMDNLGQRDLETFIQMNEQRRPRSELDAFIQEKIPNSRKVFADAFYDFRRSYLEE